MSPTSAPRVGWVSAPHPNQSINLSDEEIKSPLRHCLHPRGWLWMRCKHGTDVLVPLKCGACEPCMERRSAKHIARIAAAAINYPPAAKYEVTSKPGTTWPEMMRAWQQMMRHIRTVSPKCEYAAVKEEGPLHGALHLHVILVHWRYIPQRQLSRWWRSLTGAGVVWIRRITSVNAAYYVAKHLGKDVYKMRNPVTYSRGFPREEFEAPLEFICKCRHYPHDMSLPFVHGWGMLIGDLAPGCDCFEGAEPMTDGNYMWLALISDRWPPRYPGG